MHKYRVVEHLAKQGVCALQCSMGRRHLIRALDDMPDVTVRLAGDKPHLGFGVLRCTASGATFRVIFESINERPQVTAQDRMQGPSPARKRPSLTASRREG
jgi:hypothetical protein